MPRRWKPGVSKDLRKRPGRRPSANEGRLIAIDGEGRFAGQQTVGEDLVKDQDYFVMVASDRTGDYQDSLSVAAGYLHTERIFEWLTATPRDATLLGYGLGYDISMWLRDFTPEELAGFNDKQSRRYGIPNQNFVRHRPFRWRTWEINEEGMKFMVRRAWVRNGNEWRKTNDRWTTVWDVIKCYQAAYVKTLKAWYPDLDEETFRIIEEGKAGRGENVKDLAEQTRYALAECRTLAEVHHRYRQVLLDNGIKVRSWNGASISKAMMRLHKVDDHMPEREIIVQPSGDSRYEYHDQVPLVDLGIDDKAFYGGRFEISCHGPVPGPIYENDLTSAYPYWETELPSLRGCRYEHTMDPVAVLAHPGWFVARLEWDLRHSGDRWGPLPVRTSEALQFPLAGQGWYWSPEVKAVMRHRPEAMTIHEAWLLHPQSSEKPFEYIHDAYALRARLEAQQEGRGAPIKVGINATYGSLAQHEGQTPYWQCKMWAGMITSGCRSQILDAMYADPENVLAIATDAIYCRNPVPGLASPEKVLGTWAETVHEAGYFFARSGVLVPLGEGKVKSRGLSSKGVREALPTFLKVWEEYGTKGSVTIPQERFYGRKIGAKRPRYWNKWVTSPVHLNLAVEPKRENPEEIDGIIRSSPIWSAFTFRSLLGGDTPEPDNVDDLTRFDQPDWLED